MEVQQETFALAALALSSQSRAGHVWAGARAETWCRLEPFQLISTMGLKWGYHIMTLGSMCIQVSQAMVSCGMRILPSLLLPEVQRATEVWG